MDGITYEQVSAAKAAVAEYERSLRSGRRETFNPAVLLAAGVTLLHWGELLEKRLASPQTNGDHYNGSHG